ncbi:MAG TPA: SCO family protein, partial [Opitutus sp.]|nr:SCO family protein [Opitutus sp.]
GRPTIVTMFFASCSYACPMLLSDLHRLREALPPAVREEAQFVLVSFDSERDTPEALRAYRERTNLNAKHWTLLHGDPAAVQDLAMLLGVKYKRDARGEYAHSNLITVLNAEGEIVHQQSGLQGEVVESARAITLATK